jgi:hypothetical protein
LEVILQVEPETAGPSVRRHPVPTPVARERPGVGLVAQGILHDSDEAPLDPGLIDGDHHLHPAIEIPLHEIRRAEGHPDRPASDAAEDEDPGVLEVPADDGTNPDVLGEAGQPGAETALSSHDEVH